MLLTLPPAAAPRSIVVAAPNVTPMLRLLVEGGGMLEIVNVTAFDPVPVALVADTMMLNVPPVPGVPEISPVMVLTLSPAGSPVAP